MTTSRKDASARDGNHAEIDDRTDDAECASGGDRERRRDQADQGVLDRARAHDGHQHCRESAGGERTETPVHCSRWLRSPAEVHVNASLNVGLTPPEIVEAITHTAVYCGFPKALNAIFVAKRVFAEHDLLPVDAPAA